MSQSIALKGGAISLVNDADHLHLAQYTWFMLADGYAVGLLPVGEGQFALQFMHRVILGPGPGVLVDYINGDPLDNRRANLRLASSHQNHQNRWVKSNSHTGLKGMCWHRERGKYYARIQLHGLRCHLGFYADARLPWLRGTAASQQARSHRVSASSRTASSTRPPSSTI